MGDRQGDEGKGLSSCWSLGRGVRAVLWVSGPLDIDGAILLLKNIAVLYEAELGALLDEVNAIEAEATTREGSFAAAIMEDLRGPYCGVCGGKGTNSNGTPTGPVDVTCDTCEGTGRLDG